MKNPSQVAEGMLASGKTKVSHPTGRLLLLALLAGMYIAFAGVGATYAAVSVPLPSIAKLVSAAVFPAGLAMVLLAGSELFTGNCLIIVPVLQKQVKVSAMLRNWVLVWLGNLAGGILVAALLGVGHIYEALNGGFGAAAISAAAAKCNLSFGTAFFRGVLCNILVCLAVWIAAAADDVAGKIAGLYFPILLFVLCGFEHCVANMYYIPAGLFAAAFTGTALPEGLSIAGMFCNLVPVTLGNLVGGVLLGAVYRTIYLKKEN